MRCYDAFIASQGICIDASPTIEELTKLAEQHLTANNPGEAAKYSRAALGREPNHAPALHLHGVAAYRLGQRELAYTLFESAIARQPLLTYHLDLIEAYRLDWLFDEALAAAHRAVALWPRERAAARALGFVQFDRGALAEAIVQFRRAIALDPGDAVAHMRLGQSLLANRDGREGWGEYEWRFRLPGLAPLMPATDRPKWDGAPCAGTLLVVAGEGFGDTIQFIRFIPQVARRCGKLVIACSQDMQPFIRQQEAAVHTFQHWSEMPAFDVHCMLSSVPGLFGTDPAAPLASIPYIRPDETRARAWRERLAGAIPAGLRRVGLVWAGRPTHPNDRRRSMDFGQLLPLTGVPGVALISLQKGAPAAPAPAIAGPAPLFDFTADIADFANTAALIDNLDLVVSVDTAVAHLAGAMGKPVWTLLPYAADWRWLTGRDDTPWYPTMRLFRQKAPGQWRDVITAVVAELRALGA
jgi:hypothetical protein